MYYKNYAAQQMAKVDSLKSQKSRTLETVKNTNYTLIGNKQYSIAPEQKAKMINEASAEFDAHIQQIFDETAAHLASAKKTAFQALTAAQPVPTADERAQAGDVVNQYERSKDMQKQLKFQQELEHHFENETVKMFPFALAAKEIYSQDEIPTELLDKIAPALPQKRAALQDIDQAENDIEVYQLTSKLVAGGLSAPESIAIKMRLQSLGANPNV